jgi:orotidine-5'-phosphate decarboxylase
VTVSFAARFAAVRAARGPLAFGLDPSGALLSRWGLGDDPDGLDRFADLAVSAAADTVGLVKPQSAFYERHGWRGIRTLQRLITDARSAGLLVVLDVKRGDVGSTNDAYAEAYLGPGAPLAADAVTVHPYLGVGAMAAFVARASASGSCVLIVTRSTNPDGREVQAAVGPDGLSVEAALLRRIRKLNDAALNGSRPENTRPENSGPAETGPDQTGPVGAVVSPARLAPGLDLAAARAVFLAPGVGAQGATSADVAATFAACPDRVIPSASRSLLAAGPDPGALRDAAAALAAEVRAALAPVAS